MEPAGPNKLGAEPSFKSKGFVNPMIISPRLEKQLLVKLCVWGQVNLFTAIHHRTLAHIMQICYLVTCSHHGSGI